MNKIINILLLGVVLVLGVIFMTLVWIIGMIFLLTNEIVGSRKFKARFHELNNIIMDEFKGVFNVFHKLDRVY